uniref:Fe2OG dioxygenase domain-containing protein n=1 Tax=Chaetoceros debilis TaxID=122233 RepID=A0A7S3VH82_9STRA|mmetsp:Transcript_13344/g.19436  ORF Transcript_13344/g.19436 Transcript_13344/m.19436 type:complete len:617 (+) Transcript_13344:139-1989(+)
MKFSRSSLISSIAISFTIPSCDCFVPQITHNANQHRLKAMGLASSPPIDRVVSCRSLGGEVRRIKLENEDDGFLAALSVPTFASFVTHGNDKDPTNTSTTNPKRMGLEALVPGAFVVQDALSDESCEDIINACESLGFGEFNAGKNHHGAMQLLVTSEAAQAVAKAISPLIDMGSVNDMAASMPRAKEDIEFDVVGLNRRWRVYRYQQGGEESFAPHIDAGFSPSTLSADGSTLIWDACEDDDDKKEYAPDTVSRLTVLMYLNDDFEGGHTKFYPPVSSPAIPEAIAAVKPRTGSVLLFPQAVGEDNVEFARQNWPLHEGSPVISGSRPKYVIRSDILFTQARSGLTEEEKKDPLWKNDELVRSAFLPKSPAISSLFSNHIRNLYNPHMGVENAGPLLYSLVRFTKIKQIVEIGAGFTTPWLLQALKDNDDEMNSIKQLEDQGDCRLLDYPFTPEGIVEEYINGESSLLCIDNCLHQRETATGAGAVAKTLGLSDYLNFIKGDAYDMQFEPESIDLLWCDFGVGSRMKDFACSAWPSIRKGGFLVCHSTLTNRGTREWLEAVRNREGEDKTGIPVGEFVEISFLEPQKHYQNSITILQRRRSQKGVYEEPIYSEYA